jgi:DNA-binding transcriptional regulator GbsR (MarR family)
MASTISIQKRTFVEEVGVAFEQTGLPRMAGRIFGWLLISDPPYQSPDELTGVLMASRGSISNNIDLLIRLGLIQRYAIVGERHDHFQLREDAMRRTIKHGLEDEIRMFRTLAERGLDLVRNESAARTHRLEEMRDRYEFLEKALPGLMERYEKKREKQQLKMLLKDSGRETCEV